MAPRAREHADAVFHDPSTMSRAVRALLRDRVVDRRSVHVSRATVVGDQIVTAPPNRSGFGVGAVAGAVVGVALSLALILTASLWAPAHAVTELVMVLVAGGAFGALVGAIGVAVLDRAGELASSSSAIYRDLVVRVDVGSEGELGRVRRALAGMGGEIVAPA